MKIWHKFTEKLPEVCKELVLRSNEYGLYEYQSAMAVEEWDSKAQESYTFIEHNLECSDGAYKQYSSCEMSSRFRADKETETEWCYLEDLCKTMSINDENP